MLSASEHHSSLIADEVFGPYDMSPDVHCANILTSQSFVPLFSLNGISKLLGLPQLKLSWIVVDGNLQQRDEALIDLILLPTHFSRSIHLYKSHFQNFFAVLQTSGIKFACGFRRTIDSCKRFLRIQVRRCFESKAGGIPFSSFRKSTVTTIGLKKFLLTKTSSYNRDTF